MASAFERDRKEVVDLLSQRRPTLEMCPCVSGPCSAGDAGAFSRFFRCLCQGDVPGSGSWCGLRWPEGETVDLRRGLHHNSKLLAPCASVTGPLCVCCSRQRVPCLLHGANGCLLCGANLYDGFRLLLPVSVTQKLLHLWIAASILCWPMLSLGPGCMFFPCATSFLLVQVPCGPFLCVIGKCQVDFEFSKVASFSLSKADFSACLWSYQSYRYVQRVFWRLGWFTSCLGLCMSQQTCNLRLWKQRELGGILWLSSV